MHGILRKRLNYGSTFYNLLYFEFWNSFHPFPNLWSLFFLCLSQLKNLYGRKPKKKKKEVINPLQISSNSLQNSREGEFVFHWLQFMQIGSKELTYWKKLAFVLIYWIVSMTESLRLDSLTSGFLSLLTPAESALTSGAAAKFINNVG